MKNKRNPLSFLEESFQSLKEYLEGDSKNGKLFFDTAFIQNLQKETQAILYLCDSLNKDQNFIHKINGLVDTDQSKTLLYKTEHFFLSDLIASYEQLLPKENEKSRFVLAYYYDVLRNNHFADHVQTASLNQLVTTQEFKNHLIKIRKENSLLSTNKKQGAYFITAILSDTQLAIQKDIVRHYQNFIQSAFDLTFKQENDIKEFFDISPENKPVENKNVSIPKEEDTLKKVLKELDELIGLENVKKDVHELINLLEIQKKRAKEGLKNPEVTLHTVFLGPPGTGKTTVARLLSRIYKHLGFLSKGQLYETDREGLVAGYVGQTATKVDKVVDESLGGVLFIDEAYSLTQNMMGNDFGGEAINTLLKRMEDHRDDFAVVVAGYTEPMKLFVESNPGLRSRFNRYFYFDHFKPSELFEIFESFCKKSDFVISEDAREKLNDTFELIYEKKDDSFGNARVVRNLFEKCIQNQANRIVKLPKLNQKILKTFEEADIPEPKDTQKTVGFFAEEK